VPPQEIASHVQVEPTQCMPAPQAAPVPHRQAPVAEQALAPTPQSAQTAPAGAHWETVRGDTQLPLL
jgi:hypothetical protein